MKVTLVMALTVDGKIGRTADHFPDWTCKADKRMFKDISSRAGVVIMGSKTFDTIGKPLPGRKNVILSRRTDRNSQWSNLIYSSDNPVELLKQLEREGFNEVVLAGGSHINTAFARDNLIDEMLITFSPKVFGKGISIFSEEVSMDLELLETKLLDKNSVFVRYRVVK